jgi:hypothetical protein
MLTVGRWRDGWGLHTAWVDLQVNATSLLLTTIQGKE